MAVMPVTISFDANKANAVNNAIQGGLEQLIRAGVVTIPESVTYSAYVLGQLVALRGIQYDPTKGFAPMVDGYMHASEGLAQLAQREGKEQ